MDKTTWIFPLDIQCQGGDWMPPEYGISILCEFSPSILLRDKDNQPAQTFDDLCDAQGRRVCHETSFTIDSASVPCNTVSKLEVQKYKETIQKTLEASSFRPHHDRLQKFDDEIKRISDFKDVIAQIDLSNLNIKSAHHNFKRARNSNQHISTSVFLDGYQFIADPRFRVFVKSTLEDLCKEFMPGKTFTIPGTTRISKHNLHTSVSLYTLLTLRKQVDNYLNRICLSRKLISQYPVYMADKFCWNDIEAVLIHKGTAEYQHYFENFPGKEHFEDIYFIRQPYNSNGLVRDAHQDNFFLSKGIVLAKSKTERQRNGKAWNMFFIPDLSKLCTSHVTKNVEKWENIKEEHCQQ